MRKFLLYYFQVAQFYDPSFVELHTSRGTENYEHKIFMRNSVSSRVFFRQNNLIGSN